MNKHLHSVGASIALTLLAVSSNHKAEALDIVLDFNSLPSAQGWTYNGDVGAIETSVFSVSGGMLHQNSIGIGSSLINVLGGAYYSLPVAVDLNVPWVLTVRARINQEEFPESNSFGFAASVGIGDQLSIFGLGANRVQADHLPFGQPIYSLDTTSQFHDYRLVGDPGIGTSLYVDGTLVDSGPQSTHASLNILQLGDVTRGPNVSADIARFEFSQVPEPSTTAFGVLSFVVVMFRRRRTKQTEANA